MRTCEESIEAKCLFNTARDQNVSPNSIGWYFIHNFFALYSFCSQLLQYVCIHLQEKQQMKTRTKMAEILVHSQFLILSFLIVIAICSRQTIEGFSVDLVC
jgi:hypothetical protein